MFHSSNTVFPGQFNGTGDHRWSQFNTHLNPESIPLAANEDSETSGGSSTHCSISAVSESHSPVASTSANRISSQTEQFRSNGPIDIQVRNVVCAFRVPCHIDLRQLAESSCHVYFERSKGVVHKAMRVPKCYARIWSSGKVTLIGCKSEEAAKKSARVITRIIQKKFPKAKLCNYQVSNIMATCHLPFGVRIEELATNAEAFRDKNTKIEYEPELTVGLIWRSKDPVSTLRIHTTGSITVTGAKSEQGLLTVLETVYPILLKFACEKPDTSAKNKRKESRKKGSGPSEFTDSGVLEWLDDYENDDSDDDDDDFSDESDSFEEF